MLQLSIVIPMYNVEPYVEKCIRSLEDQDIPKEDYEIICINDGSPDNCKAVIQELQCEFNNIQLIDQENQGVSAARNNGIDIAQGHYLLFIDPDDYVLSNSFSSILNKAKSDHAEIAFLGFTVLDTDGNKKNSILNQQVGSKIISGVDAYFASRGDGLTDPDRMWAILYDLNFINSNELRFLPNVPYLEDGEFIARILCLAKRCIFIDIPFYERTTRIGSATNSNLYFSEKAVTGFILAAKNLKNFQRNRNLNKEQTIFINHPISKFVLLAMNSALQRPLLKSYSNVIGKLRSNNLLVLQSEGVAKAYQGNTNLYNNWKYYFLWSAFYRECKYLIKRILK